MQKLMALIFLMTICHVPTMAQDHPRFAAFVGYQYAHYPYRTQDYPAMSGNGWMISATGYVNRWFGLEADITGAYRDSFSHDYTFMGGPFLALRTDHFTPFVHALFGGYKFGKLKLMGGCAGVGGGLDIRILKHQAVRVQVDRLGGTYTEAPSPPYPVVYNVLPMRNTMRFSTGIVFRF